MGHRSFGEIRIETQQLIKRLLEVKEGEIVTYAELSALVGDDVQTGIAHLLRTARAKAERENNCLFSVVLNVGLKRLSPGESPGEIDRYRDQIRRRARRGFRRSTYVAFEKLTDDEKRELNTSRTILHFVANASTDRAAKRIGSAVKASGNALTFGKTLEHFAK